MTDAPSPGIPSDPEPVVEAPAGAVPATADAAVGSDHIIGMGFDKVTRAGEVLLNLANLAREGQITLTDAVVVYKGDDERVHVKQTVDLDPKRGALSGTLWGLLVGSFFGPVGAVLGAASGAASGGLAGKLIDLGLDDAWVRQVAEWIDPGTSALLVLVSDDVRPVVVRELSRFEGQVLYCTFPDAVRHELERALGHSTGDRADTGGTQVIVDEPAV
ncbi:DUF1269 domain-containing protein [Aquihabitans sp. G128]|uniref:DUF1269 domain-containing protein n=1 Tax=Aquihabitans sp. G128 TaxID=2849779 RepID=UPI001C21095A|nr:DUF1269 domain-containing protein [Aquihabitans sp. G128]QXC60140.1 DUF1269 domain-containing protein [Aquihabitans sp. G128]